MGYKRGREGKGFMSDFSIFLEQLIRENGYSIYGFAQEAGVDRPTLHRVLKGQLTPSTSYYNIFGQESRAASPAFPPSRA